MSVQLRRPPPAYRDAQARICVVRAGALRVNARGASPLQTMRAAIELGAATALELSAQCWLSGHAELARAWAAGAYNALETNLVPAPWAPGPTPPTPPAAPAAPASEEMAA